VAMTERVHAIFAARRRQLQALFVSQLPDSRLLWSRAAGTQALSQSLSFEVRGRARQVGAMLHLKHMQSGRCAEVIHLELLLTAGCAVVWLTPQPRCAPWHHGMMLPVPIIAADGSLCAKARRL